MAWYDRRNDVNDALWDVYIARSLDGGASFSVNVSLTDTSFATPTNNWLGEYLGLAVDANTAYVAFTSSVTDAFNGDVYFDKIDNRDITIRGDFEPDRDVDLYDFAVFSAAWRSDPCDSHWNPVCDISNPKGDIIDYEDLKVFVNNWLLKE